MTRPALKADAALLAQRIVVRPLTAQDGAAYRAIRQKILEVGDGKYFSASYRRDKKYVTEEQMGEWCTETREHCIIGTFADNELVGIMTIIAQEPLENLTAEWDSTWLDPRFRRFGIAKQAYERVTEWTKEHGYKYAEVFIRADNVRSREIRERQGAVYMYTKRDETWADGSVADAHFFLLDMREVSARQEETIYNHAIRRLESTLASLEEEDPDIKEAVERLNTLKSA